MTFPTVFEKAPNTELSTTTMTAVVNKFKSPNNFLFNFLMTNRTPVPTENIEIDSVSTTRKLAPFVRNGAEGVLVGGYDKNFAVVQPPTQRLKRMMKPHEFMFARQPGRPIFQNEASLRTGYREHIARELTVLTNFLDELEEWLTSQMIIGAISYAVENQDAFTITYPRPASHQLTVTTSWADPTADIKANVSTVKRVLSEDPGLVPTDCILSPEASDGFQANTQVLAFLDNRNVTAGRLELQSQFQQSGVIYLGNIFGIDWWEYPRTVQDQDGVSQPLIRSGYAEFFNRDNGPSGSDRVMYYGAHSDLNVFQSTQPLASRRFSKSWDEQDPAGRMYLAQSRPVPVPRRVDAWVSLDVIIP